MKKVKLDTKEQSIINAHRERINKLNKKKDRTATLLNLSKIYLNFVRAYSQEHQIEFDLYNEDCVTYFCELNSYDKEKFKNTIFFISFILDATMSVINDAGFTYRGFKHDERNDPVRFYYWRLPDIFS